MYHGARIITKANTYHFFRHTTTDTTFIIPYPGVTDGSLGVVSMNIDTDMNAQTDILKMLSAPIQFAGSDHYPVG